MSLLAEFQSALVDRRIRLLDLTAPLDEDTPIIQLPPERGQPWPFRRFEISHYDDFGPQVFWNNIQLSEHTGTHFDAPVHWVSGRDGLTIAQIPVGELLRPAVVVDVRPQVAANPGFLLETADIMHWQEQNGEFPDGAWLIYRTGWGERSLSAADFNNAGVTPGIHPDCAQWLAQESTIIGLGVETVGTDAGCAAELKPSYPCHWFLHGAGKYGLTQLKNIEQLPLTGALIWAAPLPIVGGSGSPCRVIALIEE